VKYGKPRKSSVRIFGAPAEIGSKYFQNEKATPVTAILLVGSKMEYLIWNVG
jgi:hypothetical protein